MNTQNRRKRRGKCQGGGQLLRLKAILAHEQMGIIKPVVTLAGNQKIPDNQKGEILEQNLQNLLFAFFTSCCEAEVVSWHEGLYYLMYWLCLHMFFLLYPYSCQ